jgi:hypothetical protein
MNAPSGQAQARTLSGTLAKTPMPRLLMSASTARVTGSLEFANGETGDAATLVFVRGLVTKVKTSAPVAYLGTVLYELGYIDTDVLNDSLRELSRMKWLHGEILLTREAITAAQLAEGLSEQTTRKLVYLFTLPPATTYTFAPDTDRLASWGGADCPHVDPAIAVWRGVREGYAKEDVEAAFARQTKSAFRLAPAADPKRFDLNDLELSAVECLRGRALTTEELAGRAAIDPRRARELVYFLMVTKQAESLDTSGVMPAYRPPVSAPALPAEDEPQSQIRQRPETAHTKPTRPEMPAVGSAPRIAVPRSESAEWRAVGPRAGSHGSTPSLATPAGSNFGYSSAKIPVAVALPAESAKMPVARKNPPDIPSSVPPRIMIGTPAHAFQPKHPTSPPSNSSSPPVRASASPAAIAGSVRPSAPVSTAPQATRPTAQPPMYPSTGQFNTKVAAELAARRQSIFERARSILKEDYFQRLSLTRDANEAQVEQSFVALRTLWDPELLPPALEEAKNDCSFVMSCLLEAYTTLSNPGRRLEYTQSLTTAALRAPAEQLEADLAACGTTDPYEAATGCFARGDLERAERLAKRATKTTPDAGGPLALLAWIEATKPQNASVEETKKRIAMLDRAIRADASLVQAYYWRGLLHKRIENHNAALASFRKVVELNPKHMDAVREIRVYEMRIRRNSLTMKAVK